MKKIKPVLVVIVLIVVCLSMVVLRNFQAEITYLKDNQNIRNLVNNLQNPVDASDAVGFRDNFSQDGIFELIQNKNGKPHTIAHLNTDQMINFMNKRFEVFKKQDEQRRHLLTSIHIFDQGKNQAKAKITGILLTTVKHKTIKLVTPLEYSVSVVKDKTGNWKFKHVKGYLDTSLDATN